MLTIVIPMAGRGRRFVEAGYSEPKPLIDIKGRPMVWWAVQGLPAVPPERMIFIVLGEHVSGYAIDDEVRRIFSPQARVVVQSSASDGQATGVLAVREWIDNEEPLLIHNCDTYAPGTGEALTTALREYPDSDGLVPVFEANDPSLSYVQVGPAGCATKVAEKEGLSNHATTGTYYFRRGRDFVWAADRMIRDGFRVRGEYYVLPTYQYLIDRGMRIRIVRPQAVHVLGTPEGVAKFLRD